MAKIEIEMPAMGEGIIEVTIIRWFVKEGDLVQEDDPLLEVATDKVDSEIPAPLTGTISRIIYQEGEIPKIGEVIAIIENDEADLLEDDKVDESSVKISRPPQKESVKSVGRKTSKPREIVSNGEVITTPFIRFLAKDRGVSVQELKKIKGSGVDGRLTKKDLHAYILSGRPFKMRFHPHSSPADSEKANDFSENYKPASGETLVEMDRTRKLIAEHMVQSKRISPHVTSMIEVDVTGLVQWREKNKEAFVKKQGNKLTYTPLIVEAVVKALKEFPGINISVIGSSILQKDYINIGIATALPDGNLIVPVIKNADKKNIVSITSELSDLVGRARSNNLKPNEINGGTFTITNMGQYDNISGTPIINQPEVAILAVGAIKKKPGVVYIGKEATIGIRDILVLSLTYDHRVVDGSLGGSFLHKIGVCLVEKFPLF